MENPFGATPNSRFYGTSCAGALRATRTGNRSPRIPTAIRRNTTATVRWVCQPAPEGHKDTVDPEAWAIVDGKFYLTHMTQATDDWRQNPADYIKQADANWAAVKDLAAPEILGPPCAASPPSTLVVLRDGGHMVLVSPEAARDDGEKIIGKGDMWVQLEQIGKKVEACLKVAGASLSDIIETRTYVVDPDQLAKYADLRKQYFGSASPARTIVQKGGLSNPDNLVEVMAFAKVP